MKNTALLLFFTLILFGCNKDPRIPDLTEYPFNYEDAHIKITEIEESTMPEQRHGFHFFDAQHGICLTRTGAIYRTSNGGLIWTEVYRNLNTNYQTLHTLLFLDSQLGFAVGGSLGLDSGSLIPAGAVLLKTTDAGNTWQPIFKKEGSYKFISLAKNDATGDLFILQNAFGPGQGQGGSLLKSSDNGASWSSLPFKFGTSYNHLYFAQGRGYLIGGIGGAEILNSNDNGATWTNKTTLDGNYVVQVLVNNDVTYTVVDHFSIYRSTDGGSTYSLSYKSNIDYTSQLISANAEKITFRLGTAGYFRTDVIDSYAGMGYTLDKGVNWHTIKSYKKSSFSAASFYSQKEGYACTTEKLYKILIK